MHIFHHEDMVKVIIWDLAWNWIFLARNPKVDPLVSQKILHLLEVMVSIESFTMLFVKYEVELELWIEESKFGYKNRNVHVEDRRHLFSNNDEDLPPIVKFWCKHKSL